MIPPIISASAAPMRGPAGLATPELLAARDDATASATRAAGSASSAQRVLDAVDFTDTPAPSAIQTIGRTAFVDGETQNGITGVWFLDGTPVPAGRLRRISCLMEGTADLHVYFALVRGTGTTPFWVSPPVPAPTNGVYSCTDLAGFVLDGTETVVVVGNSPSHAAGGGGGVKVATKSGAFTTRYSFDNGAVPVVGTAIEGLSTSHDYSPLVSIEVVSGPYIPTRLNANQPYGYLELDGEAHASPAQVFGGAVADDSTVFPVQTVGRTIVTAAETENGITGYYFADGVVVPAGTLGSISYKVEGVGDLNIYFALVRGASVTPFWASPPIPSPVSGTFTYTVPDPVSANIVLDGTETLVVFNNSPSHAAGSGGGVKLATKAGAFTTRYAFDNNAKPTVGSAITGIQTTHDYQLLVAITVVAKPIMTFFTADKPNGPATLDGLGNLRALPPILTSLSTYPTPIHYGAAGSQQGRIVLGTGNSIAAGGVATNQFGYRQQIAAYFGWDYRDYAIPGSNISQLNIADPGNPPADIYAKIRALNPAPALILFGNTENSWSFDIGNITDLYPNQNTYFGHLNRFITDMQAAYPGVPIVLESGRSNYHTNQGGPARWLRLRQINDAVYQGAVARNVQYLPLHEVLPTFPFNANFIGPDGIHPIDPGHKSLAEAGKQFYAQM